MEAKTGMPARTTSDMIPAATPVARSVRTVRLSVHTGTPWRRRVTCCSAACNPALNPWSGARQGFFETCGGRGEKVEAPAELVPALRRGLEAVRAGTPVALNVLTQARR